MDRVAYGLIRRGFCSRAVGTGDVTSASVRRTFLEYFQRDHNHLFIPSSPVMPNRDTTIPFINAGMNQFKGVFLGEEVPASKRVVNHQKCIRILGRHNDLSHVGRDGTHHTFFEMLGNWSFGDYYKKEGCLMAWKLLTEVYGIPPERLYVTYFNGNENWDLPPDLATKEIWAEIGVPENRILPFGAKDNFWEMGTVGPCGTCTEIHYDHVPNREDASALVNQNDPTVTELWNLVFIEFNREFDGSLNPLGKCFVDTGMGYERLVAVLQGHTSNYETDLFRPLFEVIQNFSKADKYTSSYDSDLDCAYRILADHARMLTVSVSDGMTPNIYCRIRMIFRKAFMLQKTIFKVETGLVKELSNHVAEMLSPVYPEIGKNLKKVQWVIDEEEEKYTSRIEKDATKWMELLKKQPQFKSIDTDLKEEFIKGYSYVEKNILQRNKTELTTEDAWRLYDTNGMTVDIIAKVAKILKLSFDINKYEEFLKIHKKDSRADSEEKYRRLRGRIRTPVDDVSVNRLETNEEPKYDYIVNEESGAKLFPDLDVRILAVICDGKVVNRIEEKHLNGELFGLILDRTCMFHATEETFSDVGEIVLKDSTTFIVKTVVKIGNQLIHQVALEKPMESYEFPKNPIGIMRLNSMHRKALMRSNTAALLLKTILNQRMNVFSEVSTHVGFDNFKISFTGYPLTFDLPEFLKLETQMNEALKNVEPIERKWCTIPEIRECQDLLIRPGDTFIREKTPIVRLMTPWAETFSFKCDGPISSNLAEIGHCAIVDYTADGYRVKEITCATGNKAKEVKYKNAEFLESWDQNFRDFHIVLDDDHELIMRRLKETQKYLKKVRYNTALSYYVKASIMEEAAAKILLLKKYSQREVKHIRKMQRKYSK